MTSRYSLRNGPRNNRFFTIDGAKLFLAKYSIMPAIITTDNMFKLLMMVECDVDGMKPSDRDNAVTSKNAYRKGQCINNFDTETISEEIQHLAGVNFPPLSKEMVNVKRIDETLVKPTPKSFLELENHYSVEKMKSGGTGLAICCVSTFEDVVTYPKEGICKKDYVYSENIVQTDIMTIGGFVTPMHTDIGGTNRYSKIVTMGGAKIWIFLKSTKDSDIKCINDMIIVWKTSPENNSSESAVNVHSQINYIINNNEQFDLVLQTTNQEMQHCGRFPHAVITLIDPTINPSGYCLSVGFRIFNTNSMTQIVSAAIGDGGEGLSWQSADGYLKPVIKKKGAGKKQITEKEVIKATGQYISANIKGMGAASRPADIARIKNSILEDVKNKHVVTSTRSTKVLQTKKRRKEMKKKKINNLLQNKTTTSK